MTDYTKLYEEKKMTPEQMAQFVQSGDKIASTTAMGEPPKILDAICDRALAEDLTDIKLYKLWMEWQGGAAYFTNDIYDYQVHKHDNNSYILSI